MSPLTQVTRALLMFHGLVNIAQGVYCIVSPRGYEELAGGMFGRAPDKALRSIGLGALGIGWYELLFAYQYNRLLILGTIPLRLIYAFVISGWGSTGALVYELVVAVVCGLGLL